MFLGSLSNIIATGYNTLGCNECPETFWENINQEKVKEDFNVKIIVMNGPRVFLMNSIGPFNSTPPKVNLAGIEMVERGKFNIDLKTFIKGKHKPNNEKAINRNTKYVFNQGTVAYFLNQNESSYIIQSFPQIVNPTLNEERLKSLTSSIKLTESWTYEAKKLKKSIVLKTKEGGKAFLV